MTRYGKPKRKFRINGDRAVDKVYGENLSKRRQSDLSEPDRILLRAARVPFTLPRTHRHGASLHPGPSESLGRKKFKDALHKGRRLGVKSADMERTFKEIT
jgi:hypothetical protein